eukprot:TRINITY_DN845_c0_g1_i1.p1 TRINITY_DN845_c0_g1~~TRINITY_DN845_c0_g1_i1.p1  ORF type:complete len:1213 (+),score=235.00 TRINITY_DN845_c0_g1_i1:88-3639(+)
MEATQGSTKGREWLQIVAVLDHATAAIQQLFLARWKLVDGSAWDSSGAQACFQQASGRGSRMFRAQLNKDQRSKVLVGNVRKWDISLLAQLLIHLNWACADLQDSDALKKIRVENDAVQQVRQVRNSVMHLGTAQLQVDEARRLWRQLVDALVVLGEDEDKLELYKTRAVTMVSMPGDESSASAEVLKQLDELKKRGNAHYGKKQAHDAIRCYSQALLLNGLSNHSRAVLLSNRAAAHLLTGGKEADALADAKQAIKLSPDWVKGYYRKGQALMALQQYSKALKALHRGKGVDPTSPELDAAVVECNYELEKYNRYEHLNTHFLPPQMSDVKAKMMERLGTTKPIDNVDETVNELSKMGMIAEALVMKGHSLLLQVPANYSEAARLFSQAAMQGSADGMYNLAIFQIEGRGVQKDLAMAVHWLQKAVQMPPTKHGMPNSGVYEAHHTLATLYLSGHGVAKSVHKALKLLKKAADGGLPAALNTLGAIYDNGDHVPRNQPLAHEYYLAAANGGNNIAMANLGNHYGAGIEGVPRDLKKALMWYQRSFDNGNLAVEPILQKLRRAADQQEADLRKLEQHVGIPHLPGTPIERIARAAVDAPKDYLETMVAFEKLTRTALSNSANLKCLNPISEYRYDPSLVMKLANEGSPTARQLAIAQDYFIQSYALIEEYRGVSWSKVDERLLSAVRLLAGALQVCELVILLDEESNQIVERAAKEIITKLNPKDCDAIMVYAWTHFNDPWIVDYLAKCTREHPDHFGLHKMYGASLCFAQRWEDAIRTFERCLAILPDHEDVMYLLASAMFQHCDKPGSISTNTIQKYKEWLAICPCDARKIPAAHYAIASLYLMDKDHRKMKEHYEQGLEEEKKVLPFWLPYESPHRDMLALVVNMTNSQTLSQHARNHNNHSNHNNNSNNNNNNSNNSNNKRRKARQRAKKRQAKTASSATTAPVFTADATKPPPTTSDSQPSATSLSFTPPTNINNYKNDVMRRQVRLQCRQVLLEMHDMKVRGLSTFNFESGQGAKRQPQRKLRAIPNRTIVLSEMDPTVDRIHTGYALQGMFIEFPVTVKATYSVIQDTEGRVFKIAVYNLPDSTRYMRPGQTVTLIDPYMRLAADGKPMLRVDDPSCLVFGDRLQICYYCATEQSNGELMRCGKCKAAQYCSQQCQRADWSELNHKRICPLLRTCK